MGHLLAEVDLRVFGRVEGSAASRQENSVIDAIGILLFVV